MTFLFPKNALLFRHVSLSTNSFVIGLMLLTGSVLCTFVFVMEIMEHSMEQWSERVCISGYPQDLQVILCFQV